MLQHLISLELEIVNCVSLPLQEEEEQVMVEQEVDPDIEYIIQCP